MAKGQAWEEGKNGGWRPLFFVINLWVLFYFSAIFMYAFDQKASKKLREREQQVARERERMRAEGSASRAQEETQHCD